MPGKKAPSYRSIHRARTRGITPSRFNLTTWHNRGVQTVDGIGAQGAMGYGSFIVLHFETAAQALGLSIPAGVNAYNPNETLLVATDAQEAARRIGIGP